MNHDDVEDLVTTDNLQSSHLSEDTESRESREPIAQNFPSPVMRTEKGISLVWIVPLIAAIIAAWIGWKTWEESGPTIYITFKSGESIEPGKTLIRYKNVELGRVKKLMLSKNRAEVIIVASMNKEAIPLLNSSSRFWVVRPRIDSSGISGLGTLVSGTYIETGPTSMPADDTRTFKGLESPPVIATDTPGGYFNLKAPQLGSIDIKSPVYHRKIQVGEVVSYKLLEDGSAVSLQVFIEAPHDDMIYTNTRFWHVGGIEASINANGFSLRTASLRSLLTGGLEFGLPEWEQPNVLAQENRIFKLHDTQTSAELQVYLQHDLYLLHFESSVRGLKKGAPVEFLGIEVGRVHSFGLEVVSNPLSWRIPVVIEIEPQRFDKKATSSQQLLSALVENGLRARLKTGNLLTGQLYVSLDMETAPSFKTLVTESLYPEIPTIPGNVEEITNRLEGLLTRIESLPIESIAANLDQLLKSTEQTISSTKIAETIQLVNQSLLNLNQLLLTADGGMNSLIGDSQAALQSLDTLLLGAASTLTRLEKAVVGQDSELQYQLSATLNEVDRAARAIRLVAEYLERNPNALLLGKQPK